MSKIIYIVGIDQLEHILIGVYETFEAAEKVAIEESLLDDFDEETYEHHYVRGLKLGERAHYHSMNIYINGEKNIKLE